MTVMQKRTYYVETSEEFKERLDITWEEIVKELNKHRKNKVNQKINTKKLKQEQSIRQIEETIDTPVQLLLIDVLHNRKQSYIIETEATPNMILIMEIHNTEK